MKLADHIEQAEDPLDDIIPLDSDMVMMEYFHDFTPLSETSA